MYEMFLRNIMFLRAPDSAEEKSTHTPVLPLVPSSRVVITRPQRLSNEQSQQKVAVLSGIRQLSTKRPKQELHVLLVTEERMQLTSQRIENATTGRWTFNIPKRELRLQTLATSRGTHLRIGPKPPLRCWVRKFLIVPDTNRLHPIKKGIPLTFDEYMSENWLMALYLQWFDWFREMVLHTCKY